MEKRRHAVPRHFALCPQELITRYSAALFLFPSCLLKFFSFFFFFFFAFFLFVITYCMYTQQRNNSKTEIDTHTHRSTMTTIIYLSSFPSSFLFSFCLFRWGCGAALVHALLVYLLCCLTAEKNENTFNRHRHLLKHTHRDRGKTPRGKPRCQLPPCGTQQRRRS